MKRKLFLLISICFFTQASFTQEVGADDIKKMLNDFKSKGILNEEQANEAMGKLQKITPEQWEQIRQQASQMDASGKVKNVNVSNDVDTAAGMIDTNSDEFKETMQRMRSILEEEN